MFDSEEYPQVQPGQPTDPLEAARASVMVAIPKFRGSDSLNNVRDYARHLDDVFALSFEHSGYKPEQVIAIREIFARAKEQARKDGRVLAYLWF
jgi:hypothetical protein